jgi:hypothetical protein
MTALAKDGPFLRPPILASAAAPTASLLVQGLQCSFHTCQLLNHPASLAMSWRPLLGPPSTLRLHAVHLY